MGALAPEIAPSEDGELVSRVAGPIEQPESMRGDEAVARARAVTERLRAEKATWASLLEHGIIVRADAEAFVVAYDRRSFLAAQIKDPSVGAAIARAAKAALGAPSQILLCEVAPVGRTLSQIGAAVKSAALDAARAEAVAHPIVAAAISIFGAQVKHVKLPGEE